MDGWRRIRDSLGAHGLQMKAVGSALTCVIREKATVILYRAILIKLGVARHVL
jgi:hypothetical protein